MNNFKKLRRDDNTYYPKTKKTTIVFTSPSDVDPDPETNPNLKQYQAGEDLTGMIGEPAMLGTDGKIYVAEPHADNWNRVVGIIVTENTADNPVKVLIYGEYSNDNYSWTGDIGAPIVVRDTGISESILTGADGAEVLHIHIADIVNANTIYIKEQAEYYRYL